MARGRKPEADPMALRKYVCNTCFEVVSYGTRKEHVRRSKWQAEDGWKPTGAMPSHIHTFDDAMIAGRELPDPKRARLNTTADGLLPPAGPVPMDSVSLGATAYEHAHDGMSFDEPARPPSPRSQAQAPSVVGVAPLQAATGTSGRASSPAPAVLPASGPSLVTPASFSQVVSPSDARPSTAASLSAAAANSEGPSTPVEAPRQTRSRTRAVEAPLPQEPESPPLLVADPLTEDDLLTLLGGFFDGDLSEIQPEEREEEEVAATPAPAAPQSLPGLYPLRKPKDADARKVPPERDVTKALFYQGKIPLLPPEATGLPAAPVASIRATLADLEPLKACKEKQAHPRTSYEQLDGNYRTNCNTNFRYEELVKFVLDKFNSVVHRCNVLEAKLDAANSPVPGSDQLRTAVTPTSSPHAPRETTSPSAANFSHPGGPSSAAASSVPASTPSTLTYGELLAIAAQMNREDHHLGTTETGDPAFAKVRTAIDQVFKKYGMPEFINGLMCPKCDTVYYDLSKLPTSADGARVCIYIPLPATGVVCNEPLETIGTVYKHGRNVPNTATPIRPAAPRMSLRQRLYMFCQRYTEVQLRELFNGWRRRQQAEHSDRLWSVFDGRVFRELYKNWCEGDDDDVVWLFFLGYMDGVSPFATDKFASAATRKISISLFEYMLLNLPDAERYRPENVFVTAVVEDAPSLTMNAYTRFDVEELMDLYYNGLEVCTLDNKRVRLKGLLTVLAADSQGKPKLACSPSPSRITACIECPKVPVRDQGPSGPTNKMTTFSSWHDVAPVAAHDPREIERLCMSALLEATSAADLERRTTDKAFGFRYCEFSALPYFDVVQQTALDPMHSLMEGTARWLLEIFIEQDKSRAAAGDAMINAMSDLFPRHLKVSKGSGLLSRIRTVKAADMQHFVLYYSPRVLACVLPEQDLEIWRCFHGACEVWASHTPTTAEVKRAEELYRTFVRRLHARYPKLRMPYNVHANMHMSQNILDLGANPDHWLYGPERSMYTVCQQSFAHSVKGVDKTVADALRRAAFVDICLRHVLTELPRSHPQVVGVLAQPLYRSIVEPVALPTAAAATAAPAPGPVAGGTVPLTIAHASASIAVAPAAVAAAPPAVGPIIAAHTSGAVCAPTTLPTRPLLAALPAGRGEIARNPALSGMTNATKHLCDSGSRADHKDIAITFGRSTHRVRVGPRTAQPTLKWVERLEMFLKTHKLWRHGQHVVTHAEASMNGVRFVAATNSWELSPYQPSARNVPVTDGSVVSIRFLPSDAPDNISDARLTLEYFAEIMSFVEVPVYPMVAHDPMGHMAPPEKPTDTLVLAVLAIRKPAGGRKG
eukprot:m.77654 g.77654  ORF g.77654 m.77654 type:complete len:1333 (+) comp7922_c0_seq4:1094-5092(+)